MLVISATQLRALEAASRQRFEDEMVAHSKDFSPRLCEIIGDGQLRLVVRSAMTRADSYGFTNRGAIRLFVELAFLCGSAFDTDPQYAPFGKILRSSGDQMDRAERMHAAYLEYLEKVCGESNVHVRNALRELALFAGKPVAFGSGFFPGMLDAIEFLYPAKARYVGRPNLEALLHEVVAEGRRYQFNTMRHGALLAALMLGFGHGCTRDPLYPWIARTLSDEKIEGAAARAERLEKKAVTWLKHVLGPGEAGARV